MSACTLDLVVSAIQHYLFIAFSQKTVFLFFDMSTWPLIATYKFLSLYSLTSKISKNYSELINPTFILLEKNFMSSSLSQKPTCNIMFYQHHYQVPVLWDFSQIRLPATYFLKSLKCQTSLLDHIESHHKNNLYLEIWVFFFYAFHKIGFSVKPIFFVCSY